MAECRFFPECQRCNEVGDSWLPCAGGSDGTRCKGYEPMPDVDALMALADEMERMPQCELCPAEIVDCSAHPDGCPDALLDHYARRIREALGVES